MFKIKNILQFLVLLLISSIIVILNLWIISLLLSNFGNVILEGNYQLYNLIVAYCLIMVFFVVPFIFNGFDNIFLPWIILFTIRMNYLRISLFLAQKIKLSFYPLVIFFIITFLSYNFSYASDNNDLPSPNNGSFIEVLIYFLFIIFIGFSSERHKSNIDNSSSTNSLNSLDIKEVDEINKTIINPIVINETKNIPKVNLLDEILINKFIGYGVLVFGFCVMWFVIYKILYLYNNPNDTKPKIYSKKLKKKMRKD